MKYFMVFLFSFFIIPTAFADGPFRKIYDDLDRSAETVIQVANDFPSLIDLVSSIKGNSLSANDRVVAVRLGCQILKKRKLSSRDKRLLLGCAHGLVLDWLSKTEKLVENLTKVRLAVCWDQTLGNMQGLWFASQEDEKRWFKEEMRRCMDGEPGQKGGKPTPYLVRNKEKLINAKDFAKTLDTYAKTLL